MSILNLQALKNNPKVVVNDNQEKTMSATVTKEKGEYKVVFHKFFNIIQKIRHN